MQRSILFSSELTLPGRVKAQPADRNLAGDGQRRAFTPAVILFIAPSDAKDNLDPRESRWIACRGDVRFAMRRRSSATGDDSVKLTISCATRFGYGGESADSAIRPSRFYHSGWRRPHTSPCIVDVRLVSRWRPAILWSTPFHIAKIPRGYPMPPPFADGRSGAG